MPGVGLRRAGVPDQANVRAVQRLWQLCRYQRLCKFGKLVFAGWSRRWRGGVATIKSFRGKKVSGAIYEVTEECLRRLDQYEASYNRLKVMVFDEDGNRLEAVTYIRAGQIEETSPSPEYLAAIQQGYRDWGLASVR